MEGEMDPMITYEPETSHEALVLSKTLERGYRHLAAVLQTSEAPRLQKMAQRLVKILKGRDNTWKSQ